MSPSRVAAQEPSVGSVMLQRARGLGRLATQQLGGRTRLSELYQDGCAKIRLPNTQGAGLEAVLINTAGGLTGGDVMHWSVDLAEGGHAVLTTQACERIYRSIGGHARVETAITVGAGAHLDWLPQETILFAGSRLQRRMEIDLARGATLTAVEAILLGRDAMGETAMDAAMTDNWHIRRDGRLIHAEATRIDGSSEARESLSLLAGHRALATILHIAADADGAARHCQAVRALFPAGAAIAASTIGERLVIRGLAHSGLALRRMIVPILDHLSGADALPRMWHL